MLVSPIMMIPKYQTPQQLQELYLDQVNPKPQTPNPKPQTLRLKPLALSPKLSRPGRRFLHSQWAADNQQGARENEGGSEEG